MSYLDTIVSFFESKGLTPAQADGIAGNWQVESGFNPAAYNPKEGAVGFGQWEGGRRAALDQYAAATGGSETDPNTQLNFAWSELTGSESGALQQLLATNDPGSAAAAVDQYYERSAGTSRAARVADAQAIAGGSASTSSSATTAGSSSSSGTVASSIGGWMGLGSTFFTVGVKVLGAAAAAGLVIVGAVHTISDK